MRLPNGYGSISKLSGKRRRPYIARITVGWTSEGAQQFKIIGYYTTRKEALSALSDYNRSPYDIDARRFSFQNIFAYLCRIKYHSDKAPADMQAAYKHCTPLYKMTFSEIKTIDMQRVIDACPMGYMTKSKIRTLLRHMCRIAMENDFIEKDYSQFLVLPLKEQSKIHKPFTDEELATLHAHDDQPIIKATLILCYTGMRPSEMLQILRENVHLDERYMRGGIKTASGKNRIIPIAEKIVPYIEYFMADDTGAYMLGDFSGKSSYSNFAYKFAAATKALGMQHLPHDGRHTCATRLDNAGVNETVRKRILGHAISDVTQGVYTHKTIAQLLEAVNRI